MCLCFVTVSSSKIMLEIRLVVTFITTKVVNWIISTVMNLALKTKQVFERWETGNEIFAMFLFIQWKMVFFLICRTPDFELLLLEKGASYVMVFTVAGQFYYCIENCCIYLLPFHIFQYWLVEFFLQGPGGGPDPHDRPFFARILHPAHFSAVSQILLFFPKKIH